VRFEDPVVATETPEEVKPAPERAVEEEASFSYSEAEGSDTSLTTSLQKRRKRSRPRAPRNATNFLLAQAPPRIATKRLHSVLHLRPRLLLQLQQLSAETRPKPAIDVVPSSVLAGTVIGRKLARKFPGIRRVKGELGLNDVIMVKSEDYDSGESDEGLGEKDFEKREIVAVVSPVPRREDEAEMVLGDGSVWMAAPMARGGYEFTHVDDEGHTMTARWVKRCAKPKGSGSGETCQSSGNAASPPPAADKDYVFKFSIINPLSRRHPIMATLTPTNLEILDNYTTVSSASGRYPPVKPFPGTVGDSDPLAESDLARERTTLPVDEATRTLITASAVWISLRYGQGWPGSITNVRQSANGSHVRSLSLSDRSASYPPSSDITPPSSTSSCKRLTLAPLHQTPQTSNLLPHNTHLSHGKHTIRTESPPSASTSRTGSTTVAPGSALSAGLSAGIGMTMIPKATVPQRSLSTGAAFIQRRREKVAAEAAAVVIESDEAEEGDGKDPSYGLGAIGVSGQQGHSRFYRRLRALRDRLTGKGTKT
jgi:hypothetical protein